MKILVVAAHPDDEVLGCGATIARLTDEGHEVNILILGEGIAARYEDRGQVDKGLIEELHTQSREVGRLLCGNEPVILGFPSQRMDTMAFLDIVKNIESQIKDFEPATIYTHHGSDLNFDHQIVYKAVMTATRPVMKDGVVKEIYAFEIPSSTEWAFSQNQPGFQPNVFMDITNTLKIKIKAIKIYDSEVRPFPHPRSPEALRAIAKKWGSTVGVDAAEAFQLIRAIR